MQLHYLEIVTPEVDATCATDAQLHGVTFGEPEPGLGNARIAALAGGGMIGVRAPMHETEKPDSPLQDRARGTGSQRLVPRPRGDAVLLPGHVAYGATGGSNVMQICQP